MASFNVPSSPTTYEANLGGFLGVDFSSSITDIDRRRCPRGYNFINTNVTGTPIIAAKKYVIILLSFLLGIYIRRLFEALYFYRWK